jgi:hypothetical protein
VRIRG